MAGKGLFSILGISLILISALFLNCGGKEEESPFGKGKLKPVSELTPEELFEQAVKPMRDILSVATVVEEGTVDDDPAYQNMVNVKSMVEGGATYADISEKKPHGAVALGEFLDVPPAAVHELLAQILEGVTAGGTSDILMIPGEGYGLVIHIGDGAKEGTVNIGVVVMPQGQEPTTEITTTDAGETSVSPGVTGD